MQKTGKNAGYTLVELVVVIAVMVVLAGTIAVGTYNATGRSAMKTAETIVSELKKAKIQTMGKRSAVTTIKRNADGTYQMVTTAVMNDAGTSDTIEDITISDKKVTLKYSYVETPSDSDIAEIPASGVTFEFDRASGELRDSGGNCVYHIYAIQNNRTYHIRLYKETGRVELQ